jgi:hypothetical protein
VSFATITLCVASERQFVSVVVYFVMTWSGIFWLHPRTLKAWSWSILTWFAFAGGTAEDHVNHRHDGLSPDLYIEFSES